MVGAWQGDYASVEWSLTSRQTTCTHRSVFENRLGTEDWFDVDPFTAGGCLAGAAAALGLGGALVGAGEAVVLPELLAARLMAARAALAVAEVLCEAEVGAFAEVVEQMWSLGNRC